MIKSIREPTKFAMQIEKNVVKNLIINEIVILQDIL